MRFILLKKLHVCSLMLLMGASLNATDHHDKENISDVVKRASEKFFEKMTEASEALQDKAVGAAGWVADNWKKARVEAANKIKSIQESEFIKEARESVRENYGSFKENVKGIRQKTFEFFNARYKESKETSNNFLTSCKAWFKTKSDLSTEELLMIGGAVVAVVTIGGVTYVLYQNGTIKKIGETISTYPVLTTLSTITVGLLCALAYKTYADSNSSLVVEKNS